MADVEIIGTEKGFSQNPARQGLLDRFITYRRGDQTLGFAVVPDEGFTMQAAEAAVRKAETERRLPQPHKFTL